MPYDIVTAILLALVGFALAQVDLKYIEEFIEVLNKFLFYIVIPGIIFKTIFFAENLYSLVTSVAISIVHIVLVLAVAYLLSRLVWSRDSVKALTFSLTVSMPNVAYLAIPLSIMVFGVAEPVMPYVIAFNILLPIIILLLGYMNSSRGNGMKSTKRAIPFLLALTLSLTMRSLGSTLDSIRVLLDMLTTSSILSFTILGYEFASAYRVFVRGMIDGIALSIAIRYIVSPLAMALMLYVFNVPGYSRGLMLQSFMPPAVTVIVIAKMFNLDSKTATMITSILTPLSIAIVIALRYTPVLLLG